MTTTRTRAKIATEIPVPTLQGTCLALGSPDDLVTDPVSGQPIPRGYRGWDHRHCTHPSPPPAGFHHCQGDPGCTILIRQGRYCFMHGDLTYDLAPGDRDRPTSSLAAKRGAFPWSRR